MKHDSNRNDRWTSASGGTSLCDTRGMTREGARSFRAIGRLAVAAFLTVHIAAGAGAATPQNPSLFEPPSDVRLTLERQSCFGPCPIYKLTITGDGTVTYEGFRFVRVEGVVHARVSPSVVQKLVAEFVRIDFWQLKDEYRSITYPDGTTLSVSDLSTAIISISLNGRSKSIVDFFGAPVALKKLEEMIDEVTGSKRWVRLDEPTVAALVADGWDIRSDEAFKLAEVLIQYDDVDVVKALVDHGLRCHQRPTALFLARSAAMVKVLLNGGADVFGRALSGSTPLMHAAGFVGPEAVKLLLAAGAVANDADYLGQTVLMHAANGGNVETVSVLLAAGASTMPRDNQGLSALDHAVRRIPWELADRKQEARYPVPGYTRPRGDYELIVEILRRAAAPKLQPDGVLETTDSLLSVLSDCDCLGCSG